MSTLRPPAATLTPRALNRALLARQGLLDRWRIPAEAAIARLAGMQSQAPFPPYTGLWTRLAGFQPGELLDLIRSRRVVRAPLMRATIHLVAASDLDLLYPLCRPALERILVANKAVAQVVTAIDRDTLLAAGRVHLDVRPRTNKELGGLLAEAWPEHAPAALAQAVQYLHPVIQVPPRAGFGAKPGPAAWASAETWLGGPIATGADQEAAVLRYLAAFGPATVADIQAWCGVTRLREPVERLRPRLVTFRDEGGRELFDLPEAPRPDPATPAPPRFLPEFDNTLLSYADRTRIISEAARARVFTVNGIIQATILIDGMVAGMWRVAQTRTTATLTISPFAPLAAADQHALAAEGLDLLRFLAPGAGDRQVVFAPLLEAHYEWVVVWRHHTGFVVYRLREPGRYAVGGEAPSALAASMCRGRTS